MSRQRRAGQIPHGDLDVVKHGRVHARRARGEDDSCRPSLHVREALVDLEPDAGLCGEGLQALDEASWHAGRGWGGLGADGTDWLRTEQARMAELSVCGEGCEWRASH